MTPLEIAAKAYFESQMQHWHASENEAPPRAITWEMDCHEKPTFLKNMGAAVLALSDAKPTEAMELVAHFPTPFEQGDPIHTINATHICQSYIRAAANERDAS